MALSVGDENTQRESKRDKENSRITSANQTRNIVQQNYNNNNNKNKKKHG